MKTSPVTSRIFTYLAVLVATGLLFQNCSLDGFESGNSQEESSAGKLYGNGGGYTGKTVVYAHRSQANDCPDGNAADTLIEVAGQQAFVTRKNCSPVSPQEISLADINLMDHNRGNLIFESMVFDSEAQIQMMTSLMCRGSSFDAASATTRVADVLIKRRMAGPLPEYRGHVILGIYDSSGALVKTYDLGEVGVRDPQVADGLEFYTSMSAGLEDRFALTVQLSNMKGGLRYKGAVPPGLGSRPAIFDPANPNAEDFIVRDLNCYRQ